MLAVCASSVPVSGYEKQTALNTLSNWSKAVELWQSKYPNTEPLKNIPMTKDGYENAVKFLEMSGWSKDGIDKFKSDTIKSLSRFKEHHELLYSLNFYQ